MLYHLSELLPFPPWTLFQYTTLRSGGALVTALLLTWWLGPRLIAWLRDLRFRQDYQPKDSGKVETDATAIESDLAKRGTPTMGGLLIVLTLDISVLLWARWNPLVVLVLVVMLVLAGLGLYDDWMKVSKQHADGVSSRLKLLIQFGLAFAVAAYLWRLPSTRHLVTEIHLPFWPAKTAILTGSWAAAGAVLLCIFTLVGSSNAVNLTDGMDGLATGCTLICAAVLAVLTYLAGNRVFAGSLMIPAMPGAGELTVVCAALVGSCLGFLWYNCHPAQVFMGDTGSLALGGVLGSVAVLIHQPLVLFLAGGVFVAEAMSVMLQVGWFKWTRRRYGTGQRLFKLSPLHHHFRRIGWAESKIVTRFYIAGLLCAVLALSTLKIR